MSELDHLRKWVMAWPYYAFGDVQAEAVKEALARIEELEGALKEISGKFEAVNLSHVDFRVGAKIVADNALHPSDGEGHGSVRPSRNQGEG